jgi:hypothetical protein
MLKYILIKWVRQTCGQRRHLDTGTTLLETKRIFVQEAQVDHVRIRSNNNLPQGNLQLLKDNDFFKLKDSPLFPKNDQFVTSVIQ